MRAIAVIPARLASTRLPRKVLREIAGRPMLAWVYEAARAATALDDVIIATDSDEILDVCSRNGWHARLTSPNHRSGTERVHEVACAVAADVYLNIQGDEPLAHPQQVAALLTLMRDPTVEVGTLKTPATAEDIPNPNAVKVVTDLAGRALYFSRATIPFDRDGTLAGKIATQEQRGNSVPVPTQAKDRPERAAPGYFKHLGFYAYRKDALDRFVGWPESRLEIAERLEQLRFLDHGVAIHVVETPHNTIGVDTEEDLRAVEEILRRRRAGAEERQRNG